MEQSGAKKEVAKANISTDKDKKIFTGVAGRLLKLLSTGTTQEEASLAIGVDPSYVSQLRKDPEFDRQLVELIEAGYTDNVDIDNNYVAIEKQLSKRLKEQAEFMQNPDQILRVLKFANEAKKKIAPNGQNGGANGDGKVNGIQPVILILPTVIREKISKEFVLNPNNEVVGIDGQVLETLNSASLNQIVNNRKNLLPLKAPNGSITKQGKDPYSDL